jgi:uncharacterized protein YbaP (TraB family)
MGLFVGIIQISSICRHMYQSPHHHQMYLFGWIHLSTNHLYIFGWIHLSTNHYIDLDGFTHI